MPHTWCYATERRQNGFKEEPLGETRKGRTLIIDKLILIEATVGSGRYIFIINGLFFSHTAKL